MKILLIQPNYAPESSFLDILALKLYTSPYITLQQLATITPESHSVELLDEVFQHIDFTKECDLVGITCCTPTAPRAYEIADEYRRKGIKVVLGGYHPSALPEEAKQHADCVVIGEAENSWPLLLKDLEKNQLHPFYQSEKPADLTYFPPLKQGIGEHAFWTTRVETTRGCPFCCEFCSLSNIKIGWHVFRKKPVENVIRELHSIPQKMLIFCDASLTIDLEYTKSLFKEMKYLNKKFFCFGNAHILNRDDELLQLAKEAGCIMWNIGFESIIQETVNNIGKKTNKVKEYVSIVKKIRNHGMAVNGQFIFGFDSDNIDIFDATTETIDNLGIDAPSINILVPYPGTPLFDRLERERRILTKDWSQYTLDNVVFQPKNMSKEELLNGAHNVAKTFYSPSNVIKRCLKSIKLGFYPSIGVIGQNLYAKGFYKKIA